MPYKLNFLLLEEFETNILFERFCFENHIKWEKSNKQNCTMCDKTKKKHAMKYRLGFCNNEECNREEICLIRYKSVTCDNAFIRLYRLNQHSSQTVISTPKAHGIIQEIKEYIDNIIYENNICEPKKIHIRLHSSQYKPSITIMPTLNQIQNYINYKRKQIGNANDMSLVSQYVLNKEFSDQIQDSSLFTFGCDFGDGTDKSHFHLGFTSKKLLMRLSEGVIFHLDATYKIITNWEVQLPIGKPKKAGRPPGSKKKIENKTLKTIGYNLRKRK
jgi:hypothetical protein